MMRWACAALVAAVAISGPTQLAGANLVPKLRPAHLMTPVQMASANARFDNWVTAFKLRARVQCIRSDVLDRAFAGVSYDWVAENRIDIDIAGESREVDDDINFDSINAMVGFSFVW